MPPRIDQLPYVGAERTILEAKRGGLNIGDAFWDGRGRKKTDKKDKYLELRRGSAYHEASYDNWKNNVRAMGPIFENKTVQRYGTANVAGRTYIDEETGEEKPLSSRHSNRVMTRQMEMIRGGPAAMIQQAEDQTDVWMHS